MGKISKNARTDRKVQDGSKDNVKVISMFKTKGNSFRFKEAVVHKDKLAAYIESQQGE